MVSSLACFTHTHAHAHAHTLSLFLFLFLSLSFFLSLSLSLSFFLFLSLSLSLFLSLVRFSTGKIYRRNKNEALCLVNFKVELDGTTNIKETHTKRKWL